VDVDIYLLRIYLSAEHRLKIIIILMRINEILMRVH